jgi:imidazolonepropionase
MKYIKDLNQIATLVAAAKKDGRGLVPEDLDILENASIVFDENEILWVGSSSELPEKYISLKPINGSGYVLTPGIVDSHTHLIFGGDRSFEYTMRLNGADYQEIASAGGGILSTMKKTISTSKEELFDLACKRIDRIYSYGVRAIEIKSGYALTFEKEKELTLIISALKEKYKGKIIIHNTFMAAHAVPDSYTSESYLNNIVLKLLDDLELEIDSVDIFHEVGYFTADDVHNLYSHCKTKNIPVRIHADEFNDNKGAVIAVRNNALSADHLLCTTEDGVNALANSKTVATLLPGTAFFLGKKLANAKVLLDNNCKVALASDYNPGSSHCDNLILVASMAAKTMGFNIAQLWAALTINPAASLSIDNVGSIEVGKKPFFSFFEVNTIDDITYSWGRNFSVDLD